MVVNEFTTFEQVIDKTKALLRPSHMATATARLNSTTGDGWMRSSRS
jgi:hypothetical protein